MCYMISGGTLYFKLKRGVKRNMCWTSKLSQKGNPEGNDLTFGREAMNIDSDKNKEKSSSSHRKPTKESFVTKATEVNVSKIVPLRSDNS